MVAKVGIFVDQSTTDQLVVQVITQDCAEVTVGFALEVSHGQHKSKAPSGLSG